MPNPLVDDFTLTLAGQPHQCRFGLGEVIEMQEMLLDALGNPPSVEDMDRGVRQGRLKYLRAMLRAGLQPFHPLISDADVTRLMQDASKEEMRAALEAFGYAVRPDPLDVAAMEPAGKKRRVKANPPTAQTTDEAGAESSTSPAVALG